MVYSNFNTKKGYRIGFNKEKSRKESESRWRWACGWGSFGSGGNNGKHIDRNNGKHNDRSILIPWGTLSRKEVNWRNRQEITICISKMLLTRHVQFELEIQQMLFEVNKSWNRVQIYHIELEPWGEPPE